jgi:hypothetical protein
LEQLCDAALAEKQGYPSKIAGIMREAGLIDKDQHPKEANCLDEFTIFMGTTRALDRWIFPKKILRSYRQLFGRLKKSIQHEQHQKMINPGLVRP